MTDVMVTSYQTGGAAPIADMKPKTFRLAARRVDIDKAIALHRAGNLEEARRRYEQILAADPRHASVWHFLGVLQHQSGDSDGGRREHF
ncbi:MAG TPA: tetratricopeptide repeat protein [Vicinamibacterales bacterium]